MRYGERGNVDNKRKFIREYRHPYSMSFISRKLGQREYLSPPFITVITQLCTPLPARVPPSGWKREIERRRKERIFFFSTSIPKARMCPPVVTTVNRFYIFATFNDLKLVVRARLARRFFSKSKPTTPVKRISSRRIVARFFPVRSLLLSLTTSSPARCSFRTNSVFDETENLHDGNFLLPLCSLIIGFQVFPFVGYFFMQKNVRA